MGVSAAITARFRDNASRIGFFNPLFHRKSKSVEAGLIFNSLEFGGIKIGVVDFFPDAEKLDRVFVSLPFLDEHQPIIDIPDHVR